MQVACQDFLYTSLMQVLKCSLFTESGVLIMLCPLVDHEYNSVGLCIHLHILRVTNIA